MDRFLCILEDKECTNCMECQICDLNPAKICDSCGECLKTDADFRAIDVESVQDGIIED